VECGRLFVLCSAPTTVLLASISIIKSGTTAISLRPFEPPIGFRVSHFQSDSSRGFGVVAAKIAPAVTARTVMSCGWLRDFMFLFLFKV
jgi:hypothetical protein